MRSSSALRRAIGSAILAGCITVGPAAHAQATGDAVATVPEAPYEIKHPMPFRFGERLKYDVKFSRFPVYANIGELTFSVGAPSGTNALVKFEVEAVSKGALVSLFGVEVRDVFTTLADREDLFAYSTIKNIRENDARLRQEAVFDRQGQRVRYSVTNLAAPGQAPTTVEADTHAWVQDLVSAFYFARTRKLKNENREVTFNVHDEGKSYSIGIAAVGREEIKTDVGKFKTIKVDVRIFNGRYVRRDGSLFVWMTDDDRRIPVKAQLKESSGTATFELTSLVEGDKPITSLRPLAPVAEER